MVGKRKGFIHGLVSCIPIKRRGFQLDTGPKVRFWFNIFGEAISISLSRNWSKGDFGIPTGWNIFVDLSDGFQMQGWVIISVSNWKFFLKSRWEEQNKKRETRWYWDPSIACVVIKNSDGEVLPFTKCELLQIASLRRSMSIKP